MNVFAKFYEIPSMILQDIKETKRYGRTVGRTDNVKTVYPPHKLMKVFAKFDEILLMILQDFKETKRYGHPIKNHKGK